MDGITFKQSGEHPGSNAALLLNGFQAQRHMGITDFLGDSSAPPESPRSFRDRCARGISGIFEYVVYSFLL